MEKSKGAEIFVQILKSVKYSKSIYFAGAGLSKSKFEDEFKGGPDPNIDSLRF